VALGFGKNLITKISWEVVDNKHFQANVYEDNSIFEPINPEKLDSFFRSLIPRKIKYCLLLTFSHNVERR
jgi:hypothetical protein